MAYRVALDHLQRLVNPDRLAKLTPQVMSRFQAEARKEGMKATTLARHLRHIKACLRWGRAARADCQGPGNRNAEAAQGAIYGEASARHGRRV